MKLLLFSWLLFAMAAAIPSAAERVRQLLDAVRKGETGAIRALLDSDHALVNSRGPDGVPAVRLALYYRRADIAELLLQRGAALDFYDAAAAGRVDRLRELAASDPAVVNSYSTDGATPLGLAAFLGGREAVEFLLDSGAEINRCATNPAFPFAPLHSAMSAGRKDVVSLLLERGADVNVREGGGFTALHEAAGQGSLEYVQLLLERGANPSAKSDDGKLPEDFARMRNFNEVADILAQARAQRRGEPAQ